MKTKSESCFFCGDPDTIPGKKSSTRRKVRPLEGLLEDKSDLINLWEEKCVLSTCKILGIPSTHPAVGALLAEKKFCDVCMQLMRDLDFTTRAIDKLTRNIRRLRRILLDKLEWKAETEGTSTTDVTSSFDLFNFLFQRAKEVTSEDAAKYLTEHDDVVKKSSGGPEVITKKTRVGISAEIKEEIICENSVNCEEDSLVFFPVEDVLDKVIEEEPSHEFEATDGDKDPLDLNDAESGAYSDVDFALNSDQEDSAGSSSNNDDNYGNEDYDDDEWAVVPKSRKLSSTNKRQRKSSSNDGVTRKGRRPTIPCTISCHYSDCEVKVKTYNALDKHIKKVHTENQIAFFKCDACEKTFIYNANLKMHKTNVHNKGSRVPRNSTASKDSNEPVIPMANSSPCSFCGVSYKAEELEEHENQHRSREFPYSCLICEDAKFAGPPSLSRHMNDAHPLGDIKQCHHCARCFKTVHQLEAHLFQMHEFESVPHYDCIHCSKKFKLEPSKEQHEKTCRAAPWNKFKHVCEICGKICKNKYLLNDHIGTHDGAKFKCKVCGKCFKRRPTLVKHEEIHSGLKFKCPDCPMEFSTKRYLKSHSKRHVPRVLKRYRRENYPGAEYPGGVVCPDGNKCTRNHKLIHFGFPFKCEMCVKTFRTALLLKTHYKSHLPKELKRSRRKKKTEEGLMEDDSSSSSYSNEEMSECPDVLQNSLQTFG